MVFLNRKFKISIKSWISFEKSSWSYQVQLKILVKNIHWYEPRAKKKQKMILKKIFPSWWITQCLVKPWKMAEKIETSNL